MEEVSWMTLNRGNDVNSVFLIEKIVKIIKICPKFSAAESSPIIFSFFQFFMFFFMILGCSGSFVQHMSSDNLNSGDPELRTDS